MFENLVWYSLGFVLYGIGAKGFFLGQIYLSVLFLFPLPMVNESATDTYTLSAFEIFLLCNFSFTIVLVNK